MVDENKLNENIIEENENIGWTWATCHQCGEMHAIYDAKGIYNDKFPSMLCPKCKYERKMDKFLKDNNITNKEIIKEFKDIINKHTNGYRKFTSVIKEATKNVEKRKVK